MNAQAVPRVAIRSAAPDDAAAVRSLDGLSASTARLLEHDLAAGDRCCLVVEVAGNGEVPGNVEVAGNVAVAGNVEVAGSGVVVGYAAAIVQLGEAQIIDVVVAPHVRGQGVGGHLLDTLLAAVTERGARAVTLEVAAANSVAQALYRRRGFVVDGRRPRYYPDGSDALIMWRRPGHTPTPEGR